MKKGISLKEKISNQLKEYYTFRLSFKEEIINESQAKRGEYFIINYDWIKKWKNLFRYEEFKKAISLNKNLEFYEFSFHEKTFQIHSLGNCEVISDYKKIKEIISDNKKFLLVNKKVFSFFIDFKADISGFNCYLGNSKIIIDLNPCLSLLIVNPIKRCKGDKEYIILSPHYSNDDFYDNKEKDILFYRLINEKNEDDISFFNHLNNNFFYKGKINFFSCPNKKDVINIKNENIFFNKEKSEFNINEGKEIQEEILKQLILLFGFEKELKNGIKLKEDKYGLINPEWLEKYKMYYNYNNISQKLSEMKYDTFEKIEKDLSSLVTSLSVIKTLNEFPDFILNSQNMKTLSINISSEFLPNCYYISKCCIIFEAILNKLFGVDLKIKFSNFKVRK